MIRQTPGCITYPTLTEQPYPLNDLDIARAVKIDFFDKPIVVTIGDTERTLHRVGDSVTVIGKLHQTHVRALDQTARVALAYF